MEIDFASPAWQQVAQWARERIELLRARNDGDLDPLLTASLRGQIKAFKELSGLPEAAARNRGTGSADEPIRW